MSYLANIFALLIRRKSNISTQYLPGGQETWTLEVGGAYCVLGFLYFCETHNPQLCSK